MARKMKKCELTSQRSERIMDTSEMKTKWKKRDEALLKT